ncbi:uncharacterized protein Z518_02029 [Rhinocladiella mackenziei CBS 650.93]|uniref:Major facilitator superfamily (MFS) profile domain-containing protein n=1 Tax=Rhinocladiella mackenziei CBS 650.93 TaxID=1442369 RepID=A0A0D2IVX1_9EURO|nr:uncharacterized protein Z518_02029 [Rhinocladiella mackenziei CBS 650.93]KIX07376.1 hypothetical protein Z518_02029 [Rhinocladiella mackenziei CBS 650.93]
MYGVFRDAAVGQCLRFLTRSRLAAFPEQSTSFKIPEEYSASCPEPSTNHTSESTTDETDADERRSTIGRDQLNNYDPENGEDTNTNGSAGTKSPHQNFEEDYVLVTWYSEQDPDNPQNWSHLKKGWLSFLILLYTFTVYLGSSLYVAAIPDLTEIFNVSQVGASLGLSLYVFGYGVGPLLFSPLSEIPAVGRNGPYILPFFIFVVLIVPACLVDNMAGLLVLRFWLGFFGSPCLATGGASYGDFYGAKEMPYVIALWGGGATLAPALGPLIDGFAVQEMNWRWNSWELLWLSSFTFVLMFAALPETSSDTILLRRAQRLRALTGRTDLKAESEVRQAKMSPRAIVFNALIKPWEINILDPAVLFTTAYTALIYGIYYSFFESFPIVYGGIYGFNLGQIGLAFLAVLVGLVIAVMMYCSYFYFYADARMAGAAPGSVPPEARLWPGLVATFFIPIGLFIFAWTARSNIHWVFSLVGIALSMFGVFIITQCMFIYLPFTYPRYSGSLFAANGFARAAFAAGAILYARPMFDHLDVPGAASLLGGLTALCIFGIYAIYFFGASLRKRSRFAVS